MNTVIIINLNGIAFHLEEPGFQGLRAYLEQAQAQLKDNPDKTEIMADLEQAIADKCAHFLRPHKNVLTAAEIDDVLRQMGPVQSEAAAARRRRRGQPAACGGETPCHCRRCPQASVPDSRRRHAERGVHRTCGLSQHRRHDWCELASCS